MLEFLESVRITDMLDILFMTIVIHSILVWFQRTRGGFALLGLLIFGLAYLIARQLDLALTISVFQGFFAIFLVAIVILFQEEIKHFLEQLASRSLIQGQRFRRQERPRTRLVEILVNSAKNLLHAKAGAIIVLQGRDPIGRHLKGGVRMDAEISEELIGSIFAPSSPAHDGALVIEGDRATMFSCYLPLSENVGKLHKAGTRHAAALGLAELTDALCLVVSEERGTISVAHNGTIKTPHDADELRTALETFYNELHPSKERLLWSAFYKRTSKEFALALTATVVLWFFFVHEARVEYRTFALPVEIQNIPRGVVVQKVDPPVIEATFSGTRRAFWFIDSSQIQVSLKLTPDSKTTLLKTISRSDILAPEGLTLETIEPNQVTVMVVKVPSRPQ